MPRNRPSNEVLEKPKEDRAQGKEKGKKLSFWLGPTGYLDQQQAGLIAWPSGMHVGMGSKLRMQMGWVDP